MNHTEYLEPKLTRKTKVGKSVRIECPHFEELLPEKAKQKYYAEYRVIKKLPCYESIRYYENSDDVDEFHEEGTYLRHQIELPHEATGINLSFMLHQYMLEALAKGYLEFVGVVKEDEE